MSKYSNRSTKQLLNLLQNRGYSQRNGDLYDIQNSERVLINFDRPSLISLLETYDGMYAQTIKTHDRFYGRYNFHRIKHGAFI